MNERFRLLTAPNGVAYVVCPELGAPHGFSTRVGGVSAGPFDSLNLGAACGDQEASVVENRSRWHAALGFAQPVSSLHQIHGAVVHALGAPGTDGLKGDALVSDRPGKAVGVYTADCTPILLHDPVSGAVGAVHAGWRGTVEHVVVAAVEALVKNFGADPWKVRAAIGPAIGPCCFEVGLEVVEAARNHAWPNWEMAIVPRTPRPHFDLFEANRAQLQSAGLSPERIFISRLCTHCRGDLFYSWRRDQARTGRLQAAIAPTGGPH